VSSEHQDADEAAPAPSSRWRIDISPLRSSRDFRALFSAGVVSYLGSMFTFVAIPLQAQQLTGSFVVVGLLGLAEVIPILVFGLWGGALADHVDRRRMILMTEIALGVGSLILLANALLPDPHVWVLFVVGALFATCDSLQRPSVDALVPQTVPHEQLAGAAALMSLRWSVGFILGTSLGGLVASYLGVAVAYGIDAISYVFSFLIFLTLKSRGRMQEEGTPGIGAIAEGVRYAWGRKDLLGTYAIDTLAMVLAFPWAVFPFVAEKFDAPWALGLLWGRPVRAGGGGGLWLAAALVAAATDNRPAQLQPCRAGRGDQRFRRGRPGIRPGALAGPELGRRELGSRQIA